MLDELSEKIERLYHELDKAVAGMEQKHPNAQEEIEQCKLKVTEFRRHSRPTSYGEFLALSLAQTTHLMGIHSIRGQLDRNKVAGEVADRRSDSLRTDEA